MSGYNPNKGTPDIRYGAVIVFRAGLSKAQCVDALRKIASSFEPENGFADEEAFASHVCEFDARWGYPTWYVP